MSLSITMKIKQICLQNKSHKMKEVQSSVSTPILMTNQPIICYYFRGALVAQTVLSHLTDGMK